MATPDQIAGKAAESKIRYVVLCYGVPLHIVRGRRPEEAGIGAIPARLRRNEAAVDSELACLPLPSKTCC